MIYVLPLLVIVIVFTLRFGAHKLSENEGRTLKLLSGLMMLLLGVILVIAPDLLNQVWTAIGPLARGGGHHRDHRRHRPPQPSFAAPAIRQPAPPLIRPQVPYAH